MDDFRKLKAGYEYRSTPEMKLVHRIQKLEEKVRGLEVMVLRTRGEFIEIREKGKRDNKATMSQNQ